MLAVPSTCQTMTPRSVPFSSSTSSLIYFLISPSLWTPPSHPPLFSPFPRQPLLPHPKGSPLLGAVSSALLRELVLFEMHIPQRSTLACVHCWVIVEAKCLITHGRPSSGRPHRSGAQKQRPSLSRSDEPIKTSKPPHQSKKKKKHTESTDGRPRGGEGKGGREICFHVYVCKSRFNSHVSLQLMFDQLKVKICLQEGVYQAAVACQD